MLLSAYYHTKVQALKVRFWHKAALKPQSVVGAFFIYLYGFWLGLLPQECPTLRWVSRVNSVSC